MSQGHDDFAVEPVPGLPEKLPAGEHILWQGAPDWRVLVRTAFHADVVAIYFTALMVWRGAAEWTRSGDIAQATIAASALLPLAFAAIGILSLMAWVTSRATLYTITNKRVAMRIGVALTKTINLPFAAIGAASVNLRRGNNGDIVLAPQGDVRLGFAHLWPHVRPWQLRIPQPMLRAIPQAPHAAMLLSSALREAARARGAEVAPMPHAIELPANDAVAHEGRLVPASAAM
jgi:Bacterial PH domain